MATKVIVFLLYKIRSMKVTVNVNIPIKFIFWSYVIALF